MAFYTFTLCTNNETLQGSRQLEEGVAPEACLEAINTAAWAYYESMPVRADVDFLSFPETKLETSSTFAHWNGGRFSGSQYFRRPHAVKCGLVCVKANDIDAIVPEKLVAIAWKMDAALTDILDKYEAECHCK
tara:strand:+ start:178 stop:576 length:399 start_codon:yes stop_codon:yes gene_type:complete